MNMRRVGVADDKKKHHLLFLPLPPPPYQEKPWSRDKYPQYTMRTQTHAHITERYHGTLSPGTNTDTPHLSVRDVDPKVDVPKTPTANLPD